MAVLFTDIVGSSKYFKSNGDIAGRRMLKQHQNIASPAITKYGGITVKFLGDSVMAYFLNPREALKSAIKIQQTFQEFNRSKDPKDQIHIRLCIHFGQGIVEENDIFGDVVNTAAKFLPYVGGDRIVISRETHDQVKDMSPIHFERVDIAEKKEVLKGLILYQVFWDEGMDLEPVLQTLMFVKPLSNLGKNKFPEVWNHFLKVRKTLWGNEVVKESLLSDKSMALLVKGVPQALQIAQNLKNFLKVNLGQDGALFVPVQIIIDSGPYLTADRLTLDEFKVNWETLDPGEIYISGSAYKLIQKANLITVSSAAADNQPRPYYKIEGNDETKKEKHLFLYQKALIHGDKSPCFYCGDRRHLTKECPSKELTELTSALNHLGYLSLEEINSLFFNYLNSPASVSATRPEGNRSSSESVQMAHNGLFELKAVYQLRFLRTIWNLSEDDWNRVKRLRDDSEKGGLLWIGQDCIRVSNFGQAESILSDYLVTNPDDYRAYCSMGFLNLERDKRAQAKQYLKKAIEFTRTTPQKMFIYFLLSRAYELEGDPHKADQYTKKILRLSPYCAEAVYRDILFKFKHGKEAVALRRLVKLIKQSREYFIFALIDPELADFSEIVHPELKKIFYEAKNEATKNFSEAENALEALNRYLGPGEKETKEAESFLSKIRELSEADSYYAYQDIIHFAARVIKLGQHCLDVRRRKLSKIYNDLKHRHDVCASFANRFSYPTLIAPIRQQLKKILPRINKGWDMADSDASDTFQQALEKGKELRSVLDQIEAKLKRLDRLQVFLQFSSKFFKKSLIFQSISALIAIFLFPILSYYMRFLMPNIQLSPDNIWSYQKGLLILGGLFSIILALLSSSRGLPKK